MSDKIDRFIKQHKEYYQENKEKFSQYGKRRYSEDPEHYKQKAHAYYANNKEKVAATIQRYREANPDFIKRTKRDHYLNNKGRYQELTRKWKKNNRDKVRAMENRYLAKHPEQRMVNRLRTALYKQLKMNCVPKTIHTFDLVGCDKNDLVKHLESQFTEGMSWDNYGEWCVDHRRPCCSFDFKDPDQQKECFHYSNLQPMWKKANCSKATQDKLLSVR